MGTKTLIFVYGSLRRGERHHAEMFGAGFIGERRTAAAYRLVRYVEGYPALVPTPEGGEAVPGEVYRVDAEHLRRLDSFEDCPSLYQRARISLDDGSLVDAYLIGAEVARAFSPWGEGPAS